MRKVVIARRERSLYFGCGKVPFVFQSPPRDPYTLETGPARVRRISSRLMFDISASFCSARVIVFSEIVSSFRKNGVLLNRFL